MINTDSKLSVRARCELLGLHRSGLYYQAAEESEENLWLMRLLDERYLNYLIDRIWSIRRGAANAGLPAG